MKSSEVHFTWEISFNNMNHVLKQSAKAHRPPVCLSFFRVLLTVLVVLWFFSFDFLSRSYMPKIFFFFFAVHCSFLRISIQCYALMPRTKLIFAVPSCGFLCSVMLSFLIMPSGLFVNQWTKERQKQNETNVRHSFHFGCCLGVPCRIMHIVTGRIHVCRRDRLSPLPPSLWYGPTLVRIIRTNTGPYYKDEHWSVL